MESNHNFKAGDFVFVKDKHGALQSTKVWGTTKKRVVVQNWETSNDFTNPKPTVLYVGYDKVQLQSEWEKENQ